MVNVCFIQIHLYISARKSRKVMMLMSLEGDLGVWCMQVGGSLHCISLNGF